MKNCRIRMRSEADNFLESKGFYRKHVPKEENSLYLAVSDAIYQNQRAALDLQRSINYTPQAEEEDLFEEVEVLSSKLGIQIQIFNSRTFKDLPPFGTNTSGVVEPIYLSFSPPRHFDPIYPSSKIKSRGFVQSILYQILYESVFKISTVMEAAQTMLHGEFSNKPIVYDKNFSGTALEALEQCLIPFPYKVAKALDPFHYRNIDYDVWYNAKVGDTSAGTICCSCETNKKRDRGMVSIWKNNMRDEDIEWVANFDFTKPPPAVTADSTQFIVKSVYPIIGNCPVLSPQTPASVDGSLPGQEAAITPESESFLRSNRPPPLIIPNSINSHYPTPCPTTVYLTSPIFLSPSPVSNVSPCSPNPNPGCCSYFIWPGFY